MRNDSNLAQFGGSGNSNNSTHTLLRSWGGIRVVTLSSPRSISITNRGGTSQGLGINLNALNTSGGRSYRFEFEGMVTSGDGPHTVTLHRVNDAGTNHSETPLTSVRATTNTTFTLTHTLSHAQIQIHLTQGTVAYRLGGAGNTTGGPQPNRGQDLIITSIRIIEIS
jgi:hypothetical protein